MLLRIWYADPNPQFRNVRDPVPCQQNIFFLNLRFYNLYDLKVLFNLQLPMFSKKIHSYMYKVLDQNIYQFTDLSPWDKKIIL